LLLQKDNKLYILIENNIWTNKWKQNEAVFVSTEKS
jgi:hypothetical protein